MCVLHVCVFLQHRLCCCHTWCGAKCKVRLLGRACDQQPLLWSSDVVWPCCLCVCVCVTVCVSVCSGSAAIMSDAEQSETSAWWHSWSTATAQVHWRCDGRRWQKTRPWGSFDVCALWCWRGRVVHSLARLNEQFISAFCAATHTPM